MKNATCKRYFNLDVCLKMKISTLLLFISLFQINAKTTYVKDKITMDMENATIAAVFNEIEKSTDYNILYENAILDLNKKITVHVKGVSIENLMQQVLIESNVYFEVRNKLVVLLEKKRVPKPYDRASIPKMNKLFVQITGTITDEANLPLPGVSIVIQGSSVGATSDFDGNYTIEASAGDVLVYSYLGYKTIEMTVGEDPVINVSMVPDVSALSEVIVTGVAGATSKAKVAISAASVSEDMLEKVPATSAASAIQGKVAGVNVVQPSGLPGSSASITIRGATSLLGNQNPLIIVDGVLLGNTNLSDINTQDIKSFEILKGAAAASLYGSKAANGVVQIITKRGLLNQAPTVTIREEVGLAYILNEYQQSRFHNYALDADGGFALSNPDDRASLYVDIPDGQTINHSRIDNPFPAYYDNFGEAFGSGMFNTTTASVSGGFEQGRYYVSVQDYSNEGIISIGDLGYKRQTGKVNLDINISDKIKFSTSNNYTNSRSDQPQLGSSGPLYSIQFTPPHFNLVGGNVEDGSPYNWNLNVDNPDGAWPTFVSNPLYLLNNYGYKEIRERLISSSSLNYQVTSWLSAEAQYGMDNLWVRGNEFVDKDWLDSQRNTFVNGYISDDEYNYKNESFTFNTYTNNTFGELEMKTRLQYLQEVENYKMMEVTGTELTNLGINNLENVLQSNINVGSSRTKEVAKSYSGILNLVYRDRYIFDGLARYEQVSSYGPEARNQWFYRASGAYRLGLDLEEDWIDELKLRLSYGTSGLRPPLAAQYETVDVTDGNNTKTLLGNANLGASVSKEIEFGVDFNFMNRFRTSFNYSNTNNDDLVIPIPVAGATGFQEQYQNAASIESKVYEASLGIDVIKGEETFWTANFLFSSYRSEITEFNRSDLQVGPYNAFMLREGEEYGTFYGQRFLRSLDQLPSDANPNDYTMYQGIVVANDGTFAPQMQQGEDGTNEIVAIGNTTPDFNLSFNSTFTYKNFTLFTLLDWQYGGDVYNQTKQWSFRELLHPEISGETVGWASGLYAVNAVNDYFVEKGSFLKMREVSLSYDVSASWLENTFLNGLTFSVIGRNLFVITNYSGVDPEVTNIAPASTDRFNDLNAYKFDAFGYPSTSTITGAVTIKF